MGKMATAVRTCGALARSAVASSSLVRVGFHLNRPAIPVSLLIRKLSTTPNRKLRSEKEITDWVEKEMSKGWESKGLYSHDKWRENRLSHVPFLHCPDAPWSLLDL